MKNKYLLPLCGLLLACSPSHSQIYSTSQSPYSREIRQHYDQLNYVIHSTLAGVYANPSEARAARYMVWVEVPVWRLRQGHKYPGRAKFQVFSMLANEARQIFEEIFQGPERFPIHTVIGFQWRPGNPRSFHNYGLAIDINPDENPQLSPEGQVLVGRQWAPGANPFSIRPDGDVVNAFRRRGWIWGAQFRRPDFMHFGFYEMQTKIPFARSSR